MIGIPKELLEKNPGSSSSALLQGFVDPGSASWGWRADGLRSGWLGQHVWSMCTRTHFARARTTFGGLLGDIASHSWMQHCTGHWLGCATWSLMSNPVVVHRHPRAFSHRVKPIRCPFRPNWGTSGQGTFNFGCYYNLILPPRDENWVASAHTGNGRAASSGICLPLPSSVPRTWWWLRSDGVEAAVPALLSRHHFVIIDKAWWPHGQDARRTPKDERTKRALVLAYADRPCHLSGGRSGGFVDISRRWTKRG